MNKSKRNPNLCTTRESLLKGTGSLFRINGLFYGKARVCRVIYYGGRNYQAITLSGAIEKRVFNINDVRDGKINIMCIERGE